jgi:nitrate reductase assembly molybdenum cofactor insertion protein NarJ
MQILKIIALLIEYPDDTLWENRDEALVDCAGRAHAAAVCPAAPERPAAG